MISHYTQPKKFHFMCLFRHKWGAWSEPRLRHGPFPFAGLIVWQQRTCKKCGAQQGVAT